MYFDKSSRILVNDAKALCKSLNANAHLIEILDESQQTFVKNNVVPTYGTEFWLGLTKVGNVWKLNHSGKTATYFVWESGHPESSNNYVEFCSSGNWYSRTDRDFTYYPLCQIPFL